MVEEDLEKLAEEDPDRTLLLLEPDIVENPVLAEEILTDYFEAFPSLDESLDVELDPEEEELLDDEFMSYAVPALLEDPAFADELIPVLSKELGEELGEELKKELGEGLTPEEGELGWKRRISTRRRRMGHVIRAMHKIWLRSTRHARRRARKTIRRVATRIYRRYRGTTRGIRARRLIRHFVHAMKARRFAARRARRVHIWHKVRSWILRRTIRARRWAARRAVIKKKKFVGFE